jgi:predicted PurR-regulated permease PerM
VTDGRSFKERIARWRANSLALPDRRPADATAGLGESAAEESNKVPASSSIDLSQGPGASGPPAPAGPVAPDHLAALGNGQAAAEGEASPSSQSQPTVPRGLQIGASWAWRVLILAAMIIGIGWVLSYLSEVIVPVAVAILLAAMIGPVTNRLNRWGLPRAAAAGISVIGSLLLILGALTLIGTQIASQASVLGSSVTSGFNQLVNWLQNGPMHIGASWFDVSQWGKRIETFLTSSQDTIASYASAIGSQVGHFLAGIAIVLFSLFYFLYQGSEIFAFLTKFVPSGARGRVDRAAHLGWTSLSHYVRAVVLVALVDAIGVLTAALILGVPLAPALAALVFLGAFVPIIGAFISGCVAVLVALFALGWVEALIMLGCIIAVMQIEGHVLQPFLLGRAVKLHPLAVILAIGIGVIVAGIVGALVAVPMLAFGKTFVQDLNLTAAGKDLTTEQFR